MRQRGEIVIMYDIITIGSATRDVYLKSPAFDLVKSKKFATGIGECLALGSKNEASEIFLDTGGGATNAAVTFGNLKLKVGVLSRVGYDEAGNEIIKILKKAKVDTSLVQKDHKRFTSYSTLLLTGSGQRSVLIYRGASNFINWEDAPQNKMKTKWFYITSLGGDIKFLKKVFDFAARKKIQIAWNPGKGELDLGFKKLGKFIKQTAVFNLNREEATELAGLPHEDLEGIIKKLSPIIKNILIITDGAAGAYAIQKSEIRNQPPHSPPIPRQVGEQGELSARGGPVLGGEGVKIQNPETKTYFVRSLGTKPINTTGAGDAFGSGFVAGLIISAQGPRTRDSCRSGPRTGASGENNIDYALRLAILNSDGVIQKMGAKNGLLESRPRKKELRRVKIIFNK